MLSWKEKVLLRILYIVQSLRSRVVGRFAWSLVTIRCTPDDTHTCHTHTCTVRDTNALMTFLAHIKMAELTFRQSLSGGSWSFRHLCCSLFKRTRAPRNVRR